MGSASQVLSFIFFHGAVSKIQRSKVFIFPTHLPHHVTNGIIIIIKTFYMSSRTYGENFVSIRQVVAEKNTEVLCVQTNRQTDKRTQRQYPSYCIYFQFVGGVVLLIYACISTESNVFSNDLVHYVIHEFLLLKPACSRG